MTPAAVSVFFSTASKLLRRSVPETPADCRASPWPGQTLGVLYRVGEADRLQDARGAKPVTDESADGSAHGAQRA